MRCLFKGIFRTTVLGALALAAVAGGAAMVVGPDRVEAAIDQATGHARDVIDRHIDDPVKLRHQLARLAERYPERIAKVRADLNELNTEIARLEREKVISDRVVMLVDHDIEKLEPAVESALAQTDGTPRAALVAVTFDDDVMSLSRAKSKLRKIRDVRAANVARAADAVHNLKYLRQQEGHFTALLDELETEHVQLTTQLTQLEREVESIARNERLIDLLEKRQRTLDEASRYDAVSLGHITGQLSRIRTEQEARLDHLAADREGKSYEELATIELQGGYADEPGEACVLMPIDR